MAAHRLTWRSRGTVRQPLAIAVLSAALSCVCCAKSVPLERGVLAYDRAISTVQAKELLLNIARARHDLPLHFTAISSIAATYKVSASAGFGPTMTGESGFLVVPFANAGGEENPTITIAPLQGEEFTQRLLTPLHESRVTMLLQQGYDVDALLRLIGSELHLAREGDPQDVEVFPNRPSNREGYQAFRRVVAHLSWIQDQHALRVEPLVLRYEWTLPAASVTPDAFQGLYRDFSITHDAGTGEYHLARQVPGRVIVANYDPALLPETERVTLNAEASRAEQDEVLIDIRRGHLGGQFPVHGQLRLRSFHEVLSFIGRGMKEEPEFDVKPDPRTPAISENPVRTLDVVETSDLPPGSRLSVAFEGHYYALRPESGYQWNRKVFNLLYQLFQMTVQAPAAAGPTISIAK